ncbi:MAG: RNA 3'-phosphate cyclase|nr:RNA 3'-phosphate cyclase [Candidatus Lokiarchaeota archaeon]MBD3202053.1 RNA 3'-phosphate cyclase [Candidatus Lokiarchaeota archaeon]
MDSREYETNQIMEKIMSKKNSYLEIDGSMGEGGGSILRLAAGYSILFNLPIKIFNIRANRSKPGLRLQHLLGLRTLAKLTNSELSKCEIGTEIISFKPNIRNLKKNISINIQTAASIGLLLQPVQIACLRYKNPSEISIQLSGGGTIGKWAPGLPYLNHVTYEIFKQYGYRIDFKIMKYGFYPKGGALTEFKIILPKKAIESVQITELGDINLIEGKITCSKTLSNARVAERIKSSAEKLILRETKCNTNVSINYVKSLSTGVGLSLWAKSDTGAIISSGTIIGEKGVSSEKVGRKAANEILEYIKHKIPVDNYLSDQLLPMMGYSKSPSQIKVLKVTSHAKTNLDLIKLFTQRDFRIESKQQYSIISID